MKLFRLIALFFALLIVSCSESSNVIDSGEEGPIETPTTTISSITAKIANQTRATGYLGQTSFQAYWSDNDQIMVSDLSKSAVFTLSDGSGSVSGKFTGSFEPGTKRIYAVYPAQSVTVTNSGFRVTIPQKQSYSPSRSTKINDRFFLLGHSTDDNKTFTLSSVTSLINFDIKLTAEREIKSVKLYSESFNICGSGIINVTTGAVYSTMLKELILAYTNPSKGTSKDGWAVVAPTDFTKSETDVYYAIQTDNGVYTFCHNPKKNIKAGEIYTISLSVEDFAQVADKESLSEGRFFYKPEVEEPEPEDENTVKGVIKYNDGTLASGVSVSDGFSVVHTGADGSFRITPHQDAWYIYYSIPADCRVVSNSNGIPGFFTKLEEGRKAYNFTLSKLEGGAEAKFKLLCLADPQCSKAANRTRFNNESVPFIKNFVNTSDAPCYGVTLGDIVSSSSSNDTSDQMPYMRSHMAYDNIGMHVFQTMGNHDNVFFSTSQPIDADENSSTPNLKAQRKFEDIFGPINHSWNRGNAHIVCMRDIIYRNTTNSSDYYIGFTNEQYEWLRQDLALVPKDKMVILCVHIPILNSINDNVQKVLALLREFKEAHIMAGHTHYMRNEPTLTSGIYEHVHAAVCGAWWYSNVNGDGAPNGFGVYDIEGNTITNWYYQGVNSGMNGRDYQLRLYRGNHKSGGSYEHFAQQHGDGVILANAFNADSSWTLKVYENDVYTGTMTMIPNKKEEPKKGSGQSNPTKPSTTSSQDWWAIGYHVGVVGRSRSSYNTNGFHLYKYTLKDKTAKVRVEATDRFGQVYATSTITADYDYSLVAPK